MNIYEKINKIMSEVIELKKDGHAAFGSTDYMFLSEAKTTKIFREKLIEHKLILFPINVEETRDLKITHGKYTYRLLNIENPEEYIDLMATGQGHDSTDKGSGKASSYAYKYLLWRTFAVPSGDDPDNITSEETISAEKQRKIAEAKAWQAAEAEVLKAAAKLDMTPKDVQDEFKRTKKGKEFMNATIEELGKMKVYYEKQKKQSV